MVTEINYRHNIGRVDFDSENFVEMVYNVQVHYNGILSVRFLLFHYYIIGN